MSKLLFSGVLFLLVSLGSCSPIQCRKSQVFNELHEAIINKKQTAVDLAHEVDVEYIRNWISVDREFYGEYYSMNPHSNRPFETTFINLALIYNQINVVEILIERGASVLIEDDYCNTALHVASSLGHKSVVKKILENLAPHHINVPNNVGVNALHMAITYERADVIQELLKKFADPFITDKVENTALHRAIAKFFGKELISMIIDVAMQLMTCRYRDSDIVSEEMSKFINLQNGTGRTALIIAVTDSNRCVEIVKLLLKNGADPRIPDEDGNTALDLAIHYEQHDAITEIVNAVRNMPKLHFQRNQMTPPLYSGSIKRSKHHHLPSGIISDIFTDDMIKLWKRSAENALNWAMRTKRDDLVDSLKIICDDITETGQPIDS